MDENHPPEPGEVGDPKLGLSDKEAGSPAMFPPDDDQELGDAEMAEGDGDDYEEDA